MKREEFIPHQKLTNTSGRPRYVHLAMFAGHSGLCIIGSIYGNMPLAIANLVMAFLQLGIWLTFALRYNLDNATDELLEQYRKYCITIDEVSDMKSKIIDNLKEELKNK